MKNHKTASDLNGFLGLMTRGTEYKYGIPIVKCKGFVGGQVS
jgi:hypothetical protein